MQNPCQFRRINRNMIEFRFNRQSDYAAARTGRCAVSVVRPGAADLAPMVSGRCPAGVHPASSVIFHKLGFIPGFYVVRSFFQAPAARRIAGRGAILRRHAAAR